MFDTEAEEGKVPAGMSSNVLSLLEASRFYQAPNIFAVYRNTWGMPTIRNIQARN